MFAHDGTWPVAIGFIYRAGYVAVVVVGHVCQPPAKAFDVGWGVVDIASFVGVQDDGSWWSDLTAEKLFHCVGDADAVTARGFADEGIEFDAGVFIDAEFEPGFSSVAGEGVGVLGAGVAVGDGVIEGFAQVADFASDLTAGGKDLVGFSGGEILC